MTADPATSTTAIAVVQSFLDALERSDVDAALGLVADDLEYINVSLPTVHGRAALARLARLLLRPGRMSFAVRVHHIAADGSVVLTDRYDELTFGRLHIRFWVYGRFVVADGQIAVWRDSFDWVDFTIGTLRGLVGIAVPAAARRIP
ncbi:limonene-1,2-epoxide hydrolase [Jatrophihabitans sp. GAS493]|uniref:limonene-1,2-epoxide hydrolase family protein n=1 Tax=Jatrophihabitans sp. GAS493 TaxID=1907575 RepID=UPI000BC03EF4|nr:limonene-1,2-epoxide hydrolase family protein [Jatrophihabitans sp. GAS493]SOD70641.1 limonene-1,2-epoxide hydrolase [Jatrophihabitans sp. GAS493]